MAKKITAVILAAAMLCALLPAALSAAPKIRPGEAFLYNTAMPFVPIILIGWLYVTLLVAANEPGLVAGILSFLFYGALPCGLILYFGGAKRRRREAAERDRS